MIGQDRIDQFADATEDHQWIHVDVERAKAGPFGGTIAHGYLTLSLCAFFLGQLASVSGISMGINYGIDKARFIAPVPAGSSVRGRGEVVVGDRGGGRRAGGRPDHRRARGVGEARRGRRHGVALPRLAGSSTPGPAPSDAAVTSARNAWTTAGSTTLRIGGSASSSVSR